MVASRPRWHTRLVEDPRVYDAIQALAGYRATAGRLRRILAAAGGEVVLDIGAGTGNLAKLLPPSSGYWALDNDPAKLARLADKVPGTRTLLCSATATGLEDAAADWTVCVDVAHHLEDAELPLMVAELARVTRRRLVFVDPLWTGACNPGGVLWRYDQGAHPRSQSALLAALEARFELDMVERYRVFHSYVLCVARPRASAGRR